MESFYHHPLGIVAYIARLIQFISAIVVLGITAWAARDTKTVTVIYSLVIAALAIVILPVSITASFVLRRRTWHIFLLFATDTVLSYLWITSFIFLALDFNQINCRILRWNGETVCSRKYAAEAFSFIAFFSTLGAMILEVIYIYCRKQEPLQAMEQGPHHEQVTQNLTNAGLL
ncbi:uncharacterized protein N7484_001280 [Penicillium longicatenatum]|uniref:uncharacterized protein n=1 Tax=Penicillium longicatenatum TaxID=1561947 RepID=UPI0025496C25|nr:uncharacterized protein N7484_001280 [Penicillium longicatenatum]KAJ5657631.1 hypothetical protein N7484_001280 [Penicillium longicatenatum]